MVNNVVMPALTGLALGVLYDAFRLLRLVLRRHFFLDFLFWIIAAFVTFSYLLCYNYGQIRYYYLLIIFSFFVFYIFTIGRLTLKAEQAAAAFVRRQLGKIKIVAKYIKKQLHYIINIYYNIRRKNRNKPDNDEDCENVK